MGILGPDPSAAVRSSLSAVLGSIGDRVGRFWVAAMLLYVVGDVATTAVGVVHLGLNEANPMVVSLLAVHGVLGFGAVKFGLFGLYILLGQLLPAAYRVLVPATVIAMGGSVTAWNLVMLGLSVL